MNRLHEILHNPISLIHLWMGAVTLAWGLWILGWHSFGSSPSYRALEMLSVYLVQTMPPEWPWAVLFATAGTLTVCGQLWRYFLARKVGLVLCTLLWVFIAVLFMSANPASTASLVYPLLALLCVILLWDLEVRVHHG